MERTFCPAGKTRSSLATRSGRANRLRPLVIPLLAVLLAVPASDAVLAQGPVEPASPDVLVNAHEDFIERKDDGRFIARPVFKREFIELYYVVRDPDAGEWVSSVYRVRGSGKRLSDGTWEYHIEYPFQDDQTKLDPERAYVLNLLIPADLGGQHQAFYAVIPVHRPGGLWNRVLGALDPGRWAKALAQWVVEGVHGTLCSVVERAAGEGAGGCGPDETV